jgi:hypothetical protein
MEKFLALFDLHWGYERRGGHKVTLHDPAALECALQFARDFKPDHIILGGDILDCGAVSHHNHGKPGATEGLKLVEDAKGCVAEVIRPLERAWSGRGRLVYHIGNHEDWLHDLEQKVPALEGMVTVQNLLKLDEKWEIIEQGGFSRLGKIVFIHGDQIRSGGVSAAKMAVEAYEKNVRLGHFHTYAVHTKTSEVADNGHTGMVVPCLCKRNPAYNEGAPNRWMQGFEYGWTDPKTGLFSDNVVIIVNGQAIVGGKRYGR